LQLFVFERRLERKFRFHILNFHFLREASHKSFDSTSDNFQI
jgi:hypothetical protein